MSEGGRSRGDSQAPVVDLVACASPVLVGRDTELALLSACVNSPPAVVVVEGEAGVGKTRLITELLASAGPAGSLALVGQSHQLRDPFPLGPVVDALRGLAGKADRLSLSPLAGALRPVLPELGHCLPPPLDPVGDPRMDRHRLWRAVIELIEAASPVVLILEDLHWADEATEDFISFLAARLPAGVSLVMTWRPVDLPPASPLRAIASRPPTATSASIALAPFDHSALKALVNSILSSDDVSDEFVAYLHERTGGIPFAVEEVLRLLQDRQDLVRWKGRWARRTLDRLEVPAAIRDSILERLGRLNPAARRIVEAAAVIGQPAHEELLAAVAELPERKATTALLGALDAALLQEVGRDQYGFRHALASEAVYGAIAGPARSRLHRRAARAIGSAGAPAQPAVLARHAREAGLSREWVRHALDAAERATALGDHAAATALLLEALSAPGVAAPTLGKVALELSVAALHSLDHGDALRALAEVTEDEALPAALRGKLAFNQGALMHQAGDATGSRREMAKAVPLLSRLPALRALAMSALGSPWVVDGDLAEHLAWLDRADAAASKVLDVGITFAIRSNRTAALLAVGDPHQTTIPAPPHPPETNDWDLHEWVRTCSNLAVNCAYLGLYDVAREWASKGRASSEARGYDRLTGSLRATELVVRWITGGWTDLAEAARALEDEELDAPSVAQAGVVRGLVDITAGGVAHDDSGLIEAVDTAARCGAIPTMAMAAAGLARARLRQGDPPSALAVARPALDVVAAKGIWAWAADIAPVAVDALLACERPGEAATLIGLLDAGLMGRHAPAAAAAALHCIARMAEASGAPDAAGRFQQAEQAWTRLDRPYEAALAAEARGRILIGDDPERGTAALVAALAGFHGLRAVHDDARVRQALRANGVALPYPFRGGRRSHDGALSPREQEVLDLVAGGATSAQVAKRLFLSPRTVDHHVERALRKLGLSSRKELAGSHRAGEPSRPTKIG